MSLISIPYGKKKLSWQGELKYSEILEPWFDKAALFSEEKLIDDAMKNPIGSKRLQELAKGKKTATIIISDHTRPVPSRLILPPMLTALRKGSPEIQITLLVATGCHRKTTTEELKQKLGRQIYAEEIIRVHDCDDKKNMICIGELPSGASLKVNRLAVETDLLLAEGFIEPHFFAGFSGGRKSVLPGICARKTVMENHCATFIGDEKSSAGNLEGNPVHADMVAAAKMAKLKYIVNVVLDRNKKVIYAVAGEPEMAHRAGCKMVSDFYGITPKQKGDIIITSNGGAPLDQNIYQTVKSLSTAEKAAAPGAVIIECAECADGIGGKGFYEAMLNCKDPGELLEKIRKIEPEKTTPDQWQYQILCRILKKHKVIFVTRPELKNAVTDMKMEYCSSLEEAIRNAMNGNRNKHVLIIPDGISTIIV